MRKITCSSLRSRPCMTDGGRSNLAFRDCFVGTCVNSILLAMTVIFVMEARAAESAEDSKRFYEKVVQLQPGNANAQFDLGNVYLADKKYEAALEHYDKVGNAGLAVSRMDSYYFNRAVCYAGLGRMDDAVSSLEACIKSNPNNRDAKDLLALYKNK